MIQKENKKFRKMFIIADLISLRGAVLYSNGRPEHRFVTLNKTPVILCLVLVQTRKTGKPDMTENID